MRTYLLAGLLLLMLICTFSVDAQNGKSKKGKDGGELEEKDDVDGELIEELKKKWGKKGKGMKKKDDEEEEKDIEGLENDLDEEDGELVEELKAKERKWNKNGKKGKGKGGMKGGEDDEEEEKDIEDLEKDLGEEDQELVKELEAKKRKWNKKGKKGKGKGGMKKKGGEDDKDIEDLGDDEDEDEDLEDKDLRKKRDVDGKTEKKKRRRFPKNFPKKCRHLLKKQKGRKHHNQFEINECLNKTGLELFEGDVRLAEFQKENMKKLVQGFADKEGNHHITKRGASKNLDRWDFARDEKGNKILPYVINEGLNDKAREAIKKAAEIYASETCIRLQERTDEHSWIEFFNGGGCWSYVGRVVSSGKQQVSIGSGCEWVDTVIHETLHALGFWHEQSRPDRDEYVEIKWENIREGREVNFAKYDHTEVDSFASPYDTKSLMHYWAYAFSNNSKPTIVDRKTGEAVETSRDFTDNDIFQLNTMYKCSDTEKCEALPTIIGNGNIKGNAKDFYFTGQTVTLECADGHSPQGNIRESKCTNEGFTPPTLTCLKDKEGCKDNYPEDCPDYYSYGYCTKSYVNWMASNCKKTCGYCGIPIVITDGCSSAQLPTVTGKGAINPIKESYAKNETVTADCDEGYAITGAATSKCGDDGFTPSTLVCKRAFCPKSELPEILGEGTVSEVKELYEIGDSVDLVCDKGFAASGSNSATCGVNGFLPDKLTCKRVTCTKAELPQISGDGKFSVDKELYDLGETVQLNCAGGYTLQGAGTAMCTANGFTPAALICAKAFCPKSELPEILGEGTVSEVKELYEIGDSVDLVCDKGFAASGSNSATCGVNGFLPDKLTCKRVTCTKAELPQISGDGKFSVDKELYDLGETVQLSCAGGYTLQGAGTAMCTANGFTPAALICAKDCDYPVVPAIVSVSPKQTSYKNGEVITYTCVEGKPDSDAVMVQQCIDGQFEPDANIKCTVGCSDLPTISGKGKLSNAGAGYWDLGERVRLTCDSGYSVSGASSSTCANGGFAPATLTCEKDITTTDCEDKNRSCDYWKSKGYCKGIYESYMSRNCQKSCDTCGECPNISSNCDKYKERGYCTRIRLREAMKYLCATTCNMC